MLFGRNINRYYGKFWWLLLSGLITLAAVDYVQLFIPRFYGMVVNGMTYGSVEINGVMHAFDLDFLLDNVCLPIIGVLAVMVVGRFLWRVCFFGAGVRVQTDMRSRMFDVCKDLPQEYYQKNKVGNLMSYFTNDLDTVEECFGWGAMMMCDTLVLGGTAIARMAKMNPVLTLFSMVPMVFLLASSIIVGKYLTIRWDARQEAFSNLSDFSQETFSGIAVIKAFVKEAKQLSSFARLNKENKDANVAFTKLSTAFNIMVTLFVESVICVILGYGGYLAHEGVFNAGQLVEFVGYFTAIVWPIMAVSELIDMSSRGRASLKRVSELLDTVPAVRDKDGVQTNAVLKGDIEFRNLTFKYSEQGREVLSHVSLKINAGENVGIIGRTGSGKSTLADLVLRIHNVEDGTLFLDGIDVNDLSIKNVREYVAYVPQDNFLFSDTIANNIAFAVDEASQEEIETVAKMSDVHGDIADFPLKYETVLGERGVTVSGGQKQRISIARALLKDAAILVLDDAVSAVDVKTEKEILEVLRRERRGKTTILTAHRISTVEGMDKIVFLDRGKVIAVGDHQTLVATCPEYANMVALQRLEDEEGSGNA